MAHEPALERLRELVRIPTISRPDPADMNLDEFERFIEAVERLYPLVHANLERERVAGHSLLYRWKGASDAASVLMAHYDVVAATDEGWDHPPFGAEVTGEGDDRIIWGRGTLDDKGALTCVLESVESLLGEGFTPASDVYLSFGHNEETAGDGAVETVELLRSRGVAPSFVLDEGGAIVE